MKVKVAGDYQDGAYEYFFTQSDYNSREVDVSEEEFNFIQKAFDDYDKAQYMLSEMYEKGAK